MFRDLVAVALFREATITAPLPCCESMRWNDTNTHVFCARRRGCRIRVTHVHACSDRVYTRNDTVRLNYVSRFMRVIYIQLTFCLNQARYRDRIRNGLIPGGTSFKRGRQAVFFTPVNPMDHGCGLGEHTLQYDKTKNRSIQEYLETLKNNFLVQFGACPRETRGVTEKLVAASWTTA